MGNKPIENFYAGNVEVAVWENSGRDLKIYHSVTAKCSYKDANGDWKETGSINVLAHQLTDLILTLQESQKFLRMGLRLRRAQEVGQRQEAPQDGELASQDADSQGIQTEMPGVGAGDPPPNFTAKLNQARGSRRTR